jgi:hypothetical protein
VQSSLFPFGIDPQNWLTRTASPRNNPFSVLKVQL